MIYGRTPGTNQAMSYNITFSISDANLINSLHSISIRLWQIDIIHKHPELLAFLCTVHKALSMEHIELYELL